MFLEHVWLPSTDPLILALRMNKEAALRNQNHNYSQSTFSKDQNSIDIKDEDKLVNINSLNRLSINNSKSYDDVYKDDDKRQSTSSSSSLSSSSSPSSPSSSSSSLNGLPQHDSFSSHNYDNGLQSIPVRYRSVNGGRDIDVCLKAWSNTVTWRKDQDMANFLTKPQPHYDVIKSLFEHYICGVDRSGRPIEVLVLKSPAALFANLKENGVTVDHIIAHLTFQHEYLWRCHFNDYDEVSSNPKPHAALIKIMDIQQLGWYDIGGAVSEFFKKMMLLSNHYPERMYKTYVINIPRSFSFIWRTIEPLLEAEVRAKVFLFPGDTFKVAFEQIIDSNQLPKKYGGTMVDYFEYRKQLLLQEEEEEEEKKKNEDEDGDGDPSSENLMISNATISPYDDKEEEIDENIFTRNRKKESKSNQQDYAIERQIYRMVKLANQG